VQSQLKYNEDSKLYQEFNMEACSLKLGFNIAGVTSTHILNGLILLQVGH
jgi:hypothetical protein